MDKNDRIARAAIETLLAHHIGLNVDSLGSTTLARTIAHGMKALGLANLVAYWQYLNSSQIALEELVEAVVVPETSFFRNPKSFDYLRRYVGEQIPCGGWRILSLPCSTGEEPYSIAMTLLQAGLSPKSFSIDGVDISAVALAKARQGVYNRYSFRQNIDALAHYIQQYFQFNGRQYCIGARARSSVRFDWGNLASAWCLFDRPPYDIIFCRNLLIYFHSSARDRALYNLYRLLVPNGLLFVGHAETRQIDPQRFRPIRVPHAFVYRKLPHPLAVRKSFSPVSRDDISPPVRERLQPTPLLESAIGETIQRQASSAADEATPPIPNLAAIRSLADRGILTEALEQCDRYLQHHPTDGAAYLLLGAIYQARGEDDLAEMAFQKALFLDPNCEDALIHLLLLCQQKGDRSGVQRLQQRIERLI